MKISASQRVVSSQVADGEIVFTKCGLLEVLASIDELRGLDLELSDNGSSIELKVGNSTYTINNSAATEVSAPEEVVEQIESIDQTTLEDLTDGEDASFNIAEQENVNAGILKHLVKSMLVGGMIRLLPKLIK